MLPLLDGAPAAAPRVLHGRSEGDRRRSAAQPREDRHRRVERAGVGRARPRGDARASLIYRRAGERSADGGVILGDWTHRRGDAGGARAVPAEIERPRPTVAWSWRPEHGGHVDQVRVAGEHVVVATMMPRDPSAPGWEHAVVYALDARTGRRGRPARPAGSGAGRGDGRRGRRRPRRRDARASRSSGTPSTPSISCPCHRRIVARADGARARRRARRVGLARRRALARARRAPVGRAARVRTPSPKDDDGRRSRPARQRGRREPRDRRAARRVRGRPRALRARAPGAGTRRSDRDAAGDLAARSGRRRRGARAAGRRPTSPARARTRTRSGRRRRSCAVAVAEDPSDARAARQARARAGDDRRPRAASSAGAAPDERLAIKPQLVRRGARRAAAERRAALPVPGRRRAPCTPLICARPDGRLDAIVLGARGRYVLDAALGDLVLAHRENKDGRVEVGGSPSTRRAPARPARRPRWTIELGDLGGADDGLRGRGRRRRPRRASARRARSGV